MKTLIVIPARLASTRLPEKLLLSETGKPLIQHTYEAAAKSKIADEILVAADDPKIVEAVSAFDGNVTITRSDHQSGTDRLAEIAERRPDVQLFINVQGDEPEIDAADIDLAARLLQDNPHADMATLATPIDDADAFANPSNVKVVFDQNQRALYFSRSPVPYPRGGFDKTVDDFAGGVFFQHVGLYVYRREMLLELTRTPRPPMEIAESLEQLRALHLGKEILVAVTPHNASGIDTVEDYQAFVSRQLN